MKNKLSENEQKDIVGESQKQIDNIFAHNFQAIVDARESLNKIIELKNKLEKSKYDYYKNVRDSLIKPKEL